MKSLVWFFTVVALFFCFAACSPSEEEYKAEAEKRINSASNTGKALQEAEAAIRRQLAKEEEARQEAASQKNKGGKK